jgi:hypothetical protein
METENKKPHESRTETMLDGAQIQYVLIGPTGVRVFRKGGGYIDVKPSDIRGKFDVEFNVKEQA